MKSFNAQLEDFQQYILNKVLEFTVDKMYARGYDKSEISKVENKVIVYTKELVKSNNQIEALTADKLEDIVDDIIDYTIDAPNYLYDEDFETEEQMALPPADYNRKIDPGSRVSIDGLKEWVIQTKINSDPVLQVAAQADFLNVNRDGTFTSMLERAVDETAYRVARKIYYVGRKPPTMTAEEWDAYIVGKKPVPGSYSKNEVWSGDFPYGNQYEYRHGPVEEIDTTTPFGKGWTKAGYEK